MCLLGNSYISSLGEFSFGKWSTHQSRRWLVQFVSCLPSLPHPPSLLFFPLPESLGKEPFVFYSGKLHWNSSVLYSSALICAIHGQLWVMLNKADEFLTSTFKAVCWERFNTTLPSPHTPFFGVSNQHVTAFSFSTETSLDRVPPHAIKMVWQSSAGL